MKILVIGGSYFLGRVFVMLASGQHEVTVVNRGSQPLTGLPVREVRGERHDAKLWRGFAEEADVLVDFCAYRAGDVRTVLENLGCRVKQYILISTVDVYAHGGQGAAASGEQDFEGGPGAAAYGEQDFGGEPDAAVHGRGLRREDFPYETVHYSGEAGEYIAGKIALERELQEMCGAREIQPTVLRPALLYGPLNYAPRETVFIRMMARDGILPVVADAEGRFQFLYVKDGAEAILKCLLNEKAYGQAYNLCGDEIVGYRMLADVLREAARGLELPGEQGMSGAQGQLCEVEISVQQAESQGFPLPFPVTEAESVLCSNEKSKKQLGLAYTSLADGMGKTCRAFWDILR